jgi:hypothetical protein
MEVRACSDTTLSADQLEKDLDRLVRYKTCIERTFYRSLKELKALQTNSVIQATLPDSVRKHVLPLTNAIEISKRTQPPTNNHHHRPPTTHPLPPFSDQSPQDASNPERITLKEPS